MTYFLFYALPINSLIIEFCGMSSVPIGLKNCNNFKSLWASEYSGCSFDMFLSGSSTKFLKTEISYTKNELNMTSASSWNGKIYNLSPLLTESHFFNVPSASLPLYNLSLTIRRMIRVSVVCILL